MTDQASQFLNLLLVLFSTIAGTSVIRKIIEKLSELVTGQAKKLSYAPKLLIGYAVGFVFITLVDAGTIPVPAGLKPSITQFEQYLFPLISKAIYDLIKELVRKGKAKQLEA